MLTNGILTQSTLIKAKKIRMHTLSVIIGKMFVWLVMLSVLDFFLYKIFSLCYFHKLIKGIFKPRWEKFNDSFLFFLRSSFLLIWKTTISVDLFPIGYFVYICFHDHSVKQIVHRLFNTLLGKRKREDEKNAKRLLNKNFSIVNKKTWNDKHV